MTSYVPIALSIAGSDPSGGAGIQMDLKTFAKTGVWGMAVITALTAQNAARVTGSWPMDPETVREQIITVLEDITPGAIKTGMLANSENIEAVADTVPKDIPLVIDPVMISTSGYRLIDEDATRSLVKQLIPKAYLITPNIPEAEILSGMDSISSDENMIEAGERILNLGAEYVMVKGGHRHGQDAKDILISQKEPQFFSSPRLPYSVHGSGCAFSAAITGYLACGNDIETSCKKAKTLISQGIENAFSGKANVKVINP